MYYKLPEYFFLFKKGDTKSIWIQIWHYYKNKKHNKQNIRQRSKNISWNIYILNETLSLGYRLLGYEFWWFFDPERVNFLRYQPPHVICFALRPGWYSSDWQSIELPIIATMLPPNTWKLKFMKELLKLRKARFPRCLFALQLNCSTWLLGKYVN